MTSETKLKSIPLTINVKTHGCALYHSKSKYIAGFVGIYGKLTLNPSIYGNVIQLHDSEQLSMSLKLMSRSFVFRVVYRHPAY